MKDKIAMITQCLKTFGYRKLDDKNYAKPLAFVLMNAEITDEYIEFLTFFRTPADKVMVYKSVKIEFEDYIFENPENLSRRIASAEVEMFASNGVVFSGLHSSPWNFNCYSDYLDI